MSEMMGVEVATCDPNTIILTHIVGEIQVPCDWAGQKIHAGDGPAEWIAHLKPCVCGRFGARLVCTHCKDVAMATEDAVQCGACGEVYAPFRSVIHLIEPLDKRP